MKNFRVDMAYDGRRYKGFRSVKGQEDKTIQGKLENILKKMCEQPIEVISAVNTDPGVHAMKQVVNFKLPDNKMSASQVFDYLEEFLPDDIIILSVKDADERFHSRYNVKGLTYEYRLWKFKPVRRPLFERHQVKPMDKALNVTVMEEAAKKLVGEHDFKAFSSKSKVKSSVKTVQEASITETENEIIFRFKANGYLLNMERIMVGTLIQIGLYERDLEEIDKAFSTLESKHVGHKAMAGALTLVDVSYE